MDTSCNLLELVRRGSGKNTAPAIIDAAGRTFTYGELLDRAEYVGSALIASGVIPTDRIALIGAGGFDTVVGFLGIAAAAACAPLNPSYTEAEFEFYLTDLRPRLLIIETGLAQPARAAASRLGIPTREFSAETGGVAALTFSREPPRHETARNFASAADVALVLHTSGTTSRPKMVRLTHRNLCHSADTIALALDLDAKDRCCNPMPLFHIHGLVGTVMSTLASGGSVVCLGGFDPASFIAGLSEFRPSWYSAVPTMHSAVLARAARAQPVHALRFIRSCSAPLPPRTAARLEKVFGVPVIEAYGMTEASHQIASNPLPPQQRKPGSTGIATRVELAILDPVGNFLPANQAGEIVVRGRSVTTGYGGSSEAAAQGFFGDWLRTGDLGYLDQDGYLFISGRIKEIINRGGEKISPREIEDVFLEHADIAEASAFAVPDARLGEDVGIGLVLRPGADTPDRTALREFAGRRLAEFKLPRHILFLGELPKGPTGKPQRKALAAQLANSPAIPPGCIVTTRRSSDIETALLSIWREHLHLDTVETHDDFFELGGDSLTATRMLLDVEARHRVSLTVADLLNAPTIALLGALIERTAHQGIRARIAVIQHGRARPPFFGIGAGPRFRELAKLLGPEQPFVATVYPDPASLPGRCRIEDIARYHVSTIRDVQQNGPYFLGGWCIDGLVAYEVAQQLRAAGELVALLVLFDTSLNPDFENLPAVTIAFMSLQQSLGFLAFHLRKAAAQPDWKSLFRYSERHLARVGERIRYRYLYERYCLLGGVSGRDSWRQLSAVQHRIAAKYKPQPYDGEVLLLHRSARMRFGDRARLVWQNLVRGSLEIHEIEGDHGDMFDHPQVVVTADKLRPKLVAK